MKPKLSAPSWTPTEAEPSGGKCTSASCSSPPDAHSFFGSLVGTTSLADLKVPDWESKTKFLATTADAYYKRNARSGRKVPFNQLNNQMFKKQITKPDVARKNAQSAYRFIDIQ